MPSKETAQAIYELIHTYIRRYLPHILGVCLQPLPKHLSATPRYVLVRRLPDTTQPYTDTHTFFPTHTQTHTHTQQDNVTLTQSVSC